MSAPDKLDTKQIAEEPNTQTGKPRPTHLYRHFDKDGALLYVGISLNALYRLGQHAECSHWYGAITRVEIQTYASRDIALEEERKAIQDEHPKHNIHHRVHVRLPRFGGPPLVSRTDLTKRMVSFDPVYNEDRAASVLGLSVGAIRREMDNKRLGFVWLPNRSGTLRRHTTGWQIIDYLEALQSETDAQGR